MTSWLTFCVESSCKVWRTKDQGMSRMLTLRDLIDELNAIETELRSTGEDD